MHHHYRDIVDKLGPPQWWDECGVPRYCQFGPHETNNIYADEVALLEIACQDCGERFKVAMSSSLFDRILRGPLLEKDGDEILGHEVQMAPSLADAIREGAIHYGDPPNAGCCPAGPTMNCEDLRVLEFWAKPHNGLELARQSELEGELSVDPPPPPTEGPRPAS
jgi:hypothetical protein